MAHFYQNLIQANMFVFTGLASRACCKASQLVEQRQHADYAAYSSIMGENG